VADRRKRAREEGSAGLGLGLLFLPSIQPDTTSSRSLARFAAGLCLDMLGNPLGRFAKKMRGKDEKARLWPSWPSSNSKFEFKGEDLKTYQNLSPEFSNLTQSQEQSLVNF
jgi:hypothetical protein